MRSLACLEPDEPVHAYRAATVRERPVDTTRPTPRSLPHGRGSVSRGVISRGTLSAIAAVICIVLAIAVGGIPLQAQTPAKPRPVGSKATSTNASQTTGDDEAIVVRETGPLPLPAALTFKPLGEVQIPKPVVFTLADGMKVYLLENHELPLVRGGAVIRTGNLFDPKDKRGLATLTGIALRGGGTESLTADRLDEKLESVAAEIESSIVEGSGSLSFSCLRENTNDVLGWFHDVLVTPAFSQEKIELARTQVKSFISRRNDDASSIAARESLSLVYGPDTPYGANEEYATVSAVTRDDIRAFYKRYFFPANTTLYIYGDFDTSEMQRKLEHLFAGWTATQEKAPPFPPADWKATPGVYFVQKDDVAQTFFEFGEMGGRLDSKDYAALTVAADVLGGGFSSRLFREVRSRLGYAYSIEASWAANYDHPGVFNISGSCRAEATAETLQAVLQQVNRMRSVEITDQELQTAKDTTLNSFVFAFERPESTLLRLVTYDYYGYRPDYLNQYQHDVEAVTKADVLRVAKEYFKTDEFTIVAVGNRSRFGQPLAGLKLPVNDLDISIPPDRPVVDEGAQSEGKKLLDKIFAFLGGRERLAQVDDFTTQSETVYGGARAPSRLTAEIIYPDYVRMTQVTGDKTTVMFMRPKFGWMDSGAGNEDIPEAMLDSIAEVNLRGAVMVLIAMAKNPAALSYTGEGMFEWTPSQGQPLHLTFDRETGALLHIKYRDNRFEADDQPSDWRDVAGLKLPFRVAALRDGKETAIQSTSLIKINTHLNRETLSKRP